MNVPSDRAIYHSKQLGTYAILLFGCKFFKAISLYISYDLLGYLGVIIFLWAITTISGLTFVLLQKPFSNGRRLSQMDWFRIVRCACVSVLLQLTTLYGLTLCGPLRYILLIEHHETVVIAAASALYSGVGGASKTRGAVMFLLGVVCMLVIDYDSHSSATKSNDDVDSKIISWISSPIIKLFGLSDHKGGVVLLFLCLCVQSGFHTASKSLAANIGGTKRLHAFTTLLSSVLLTPLAIFAYATSQNGPGTPHLPFLHAIGLLLVLSVFGYLIDFYVSTVCNTRLGSARASLLCTVALLTGGLLLSALWSVDLVGANDLAEGVNQQIADSWQTMLRRSAPSLSKVGVHSLSNGLLVAMALILYGVWLLTGTSKTGSQGQLIGISADGLPVYNFASTSEQLHKVGASLTAHARTILKQILEEEASRRIFLYLCLNFTFMFIEMLYGVWTNSLGLISDGFHMLFDSVSLLMGLYARIISRWQPNRTFTFGYHRAEVLSAFVNSLFLVVISLTVFLSAVNRLFDPPEINSTNRLMVVSVAGLLVNLIGVCALGHTHSHSLGAHKHCHESNRDSSMNMHGHSHSGGGNKCHGHSHGGGNDSHDHGHENSNLRGVYLHVLADTLGSCAVIFSSFLIQRYGWLIADPICSLFLALLICRTATPLLAQTLKILALQSPTVSEGEITTAELIHTVMCSSEDIISVREPKLWCHTENNLCATLHVFVTPQCKEQVILQTVTEVLKQHNLHHLTVQVEKDVFHQHMFGMGKKVIRSAEVCRDGSVSSKEWVMAASSLSAVTVQGVEHI